MKLEDMDIKELKVVWYNTFAERDILNKGLAQLNQMIAQKEASDELGKVTVNSGSTKKETEGADKD